MNITDPLGPLSKVNWHSHTCGCEVEPRRYHMQVQPAEVVRGRDGILEYVPEKLACQLHSLDGRVDWVPMRLTSIEDMLKSGLNQDYWEDARRRQLSYLAQAEKMIAEITAGRTPDGKDDPAWGQIVKGIVQEAFEAEKVYIADSDNVITSGNEWLYTNAPGAPTKQPGSSQVVVDDLIRNLPDPRDVDRWLAMLDKIKAGKNWVDSDGIRRSAGTQMRGHLSKRCPRHHNQTSTSLMEQILVRACGCRIGQITVGETRTIKINGRSQLNVNHEKFYHLCDWHRRKWEAEQKARVA